MIRYLFDVWYIRLRCGVPNLLEGGVFTKVRSVTYRICRHNMTIRFDSIFTLGCTEVAMGVHVFPRGKY